MRQCGYCNDLFSCARALADFLAHVASHRLILAPPWYQIIQLRPLSYPTYSRLPCQSTLFVAFLVYDTRRQEAGRLDCCCCFKTKHMDKRPSAAADSAIDPSAEWVREPSCCIFLDDLFCCSSDTCRHSFLSHSNSTLNAPPPASSPVCCHLISIRPFLLSLIGQCSSESILVWQSNRLGSGGNVVLEEATLFVSPFCLESESVETAADLTCRTQNALHAMQPTLRWC